MHPVQQHRLEIDRYISPRSTNEALEVLATLGPRAQLIAGGTDLLLELTRGQRPEVDTLIDLSRVPGLDGISLEGSELVIGATVTHNLLANSPEMVPLALPLAQACLEVASPQLRNRATIVGNVVTASPANDTISALRALGCTVEIASANGERMVDLADFYLGVRATVLRPGEMVTGLRVRTLGATQRAIFLKLGLRRAQAISVVHMTIVLDLDGSSVSAAAITLGSVAPTIVNAAEAEQFLADKSLTSEVIAEAGHLVARSATPIDDIRATGEYRSEQLRVLTMRGLEALAHDQQSDRWPSIVTLSGDTGVRFPSGPRFASDISTGDQIYTTVNGVEVTAARAAGRTLLDWLRDEAGPISGRSLTGTKEGCAEGECGACTIYLDGMAVMSCLVPAARAHLAEVTTIEGLAIDDRLHDLQQAFLDQGAVQCGFCIPGFLMSGAKLLEERPRPSLQDIRTGLAGNLCRCTGYYKIIAAVEQAAALQ